MNSYCREHLKYTLYFYRSYFLTHLFLTVPRKHAVMGNDAEYIVSHTMKISFHSCELHGDFNFKLMAIWNTKNTSNGKSKKHINQGP